MNDSIRRLVLSLVALLLAGALSCCGGSSAVPGADSGGLVGTGDGVPDASSGPADVSESDLGGEPVDDVVFGQDAAADLSSTAIVHAGVSAEEVGGVVVLEDGRLELRYALCAGTFSLRAVDGPLHIVGAASGAVYTTPAGRFELRTEQPGERRWEARPFSDPLGDGLALLVTWRPETGPFLEVELQLRAKTGFLTAEATIRFPGDAPEGARVQEISPIVVDETSGGALFVGADPARHVILDNGRDMYFDFESYVALGSDETSLFHAPGNAANWNVVIHDPETGRGVVAGFLSSTYGGGLIVTHYHSVAALVDAGRPGFTRFEGLSLYLEGRALLPAVGEGGGDFLRSELFYVDPSAASSFDGLEAFAERYARRIGKQVWRDVPTGWNSWGGGSGSGGYGTNIDEALMLENLDKAAEDFLPFGMKYFLIDDGWQDTEGEWQNNPERFPDHDGVNGLKWFADQVRAKGMIPGIWISPFGVARDSQLAADKPEWMAELNPFGQAFVPTSSYYVLDLSNPEVLDWLEDLFVRITRDWGYRWIKLDFSYYALFAIPRANPDMSTTEAYHNALARIRKAVGPDVFFLTISAQGLCFDMADGNRLGLDNEPWWGSHSTDDPGFKLIYRTVARRYYLNHRMWVNHPDLVFYRPQFGLTMNEARAWTSAVALTGGIVKLGDSYLALHDHPEWRALVTPLLPVYPRTGRPLDLFERDYPERWSLVADNGREGEAYREWRVVGLFNWGENRDILPSGPDHDYEPETERDYAVELASLGLDPGERHLVMDAWEHTWRWIDDGRIEVTLPPRTDVVYIVRPEPSAPAVVATTRHLLGGAVEVHAEAWDASAARLEATIDTIPGVSLRVFIADAGRAVLSTRATEAADLEHSTRDGIVELAFVPESAQSRITVDFRP